ncbi:hypothetical protein [Bartonella sp. DGB2]|uniref:hypothetical protein n=1 Tax=Bartonella sp. DGB2 TaxID=3388426 RepID=UPI00398FDD59
MDRYFSRSATCLLAIHYLLQEARKQTTAMVSSSEKAKVQEHNSITTSTSQFSEKKAKTISCQLNKAQKQLEEISYALIVEYQKGKETEMRIQKILGNIRDQLINFQNGFADAGRNVFQELRHIRGHIQNTNLTSSMDKARNNTDIAPSNIDQIIVQLRKARLAMSEEDPHLFKDVH